MFGYEVDVDSEAHMKHINTVCLCGGGGERNSECLMLKQEERGGALKGLRG